MKRSFHETEGRADHLRVRRASPHDDQQLAQLDARSWPLELQVVPPRAASEPFFAGRRQVGDVVVAEDASRTTSSSAGTPQLLGYAHLTPHLPVAANAHVLHLNAVAVDPAARGRGVGRALLEAAVAQARRRGVRKLGLRTLSSNEAALALYRSAGFTVEGVLRAEIRLPDDSYLDDVWMALDLTSGDDAHQARATGA